MSIRGFRGGFSGYRLQLQARLSGAALLRSHGFLRVVFYLWAVLYIRIPSFYKGAVLCLGLTKMDSYLED